jgi:hypothetical protein
MGLPNKQGFWSTNVKPRTRLRDVRAANKWFLSKADRELSDISEPEKIWGGARRKTSMPQIGSMYMWKYWAKHDKTLPTWDRYPVGFVFKIQGPHFWALNFHYLNPVDRFQLGAALMKVMVKAKGNKTEYLKLSWAVITQVAKHSHYEPAAKMYRFDQMQSKHLYIRPDEWAIAVTLGLEKWRKGKPSNR